MGVYDHDKKENHTMPARPEPPVAEPDGLALALYREYALTSSPDLNFSGFDWSEAWRASADMPLTGPGFRRLWERMAAAARLAVTEESVPPSAVPAVPDEWREAAQEFVDRVERGEIRSKRTYAKFKALLESAPTDGT